MKIFVIPSVYPWDRNKTAGIFTYEQCLALARHEHKVTVLDSSGVNYKDWFDSSCFKIIQSEEHNVHRYMRHTRNFMSSKFPMLSTILCYINTRSLFKSAVKEQGMPDIIIAHFSLSAGFCTTYLSKKWGIPFAVIEHHSLYYKRNISWRLRYLLNKEINRCSEFICVSEHLKRALEQHCNSDKIIVIPNMVSIDYHYIPPKFGHKFRFFSAGNLNENKRFSLLIESFCRAYSENDDVELYIAGDGPDRTMLESIIEKYHRSKQIILLGSIVKEKMIEQYSNCHCFVLLSRKETFGIVYREAMCVGRPVISTKNGGIEENWNDAFGILLEDSSIESVALALLQMQNNISLYDSKLISSQCCSRYSESVVIDKLESVIEKYRGRNI